MRTTSTLALLSLAALAGCRQTFPLPMTAAEFAQYNSGAALTAYLSQRDASPSVCDPKNVGPHIASVNEDDARDLVDGLTRGEDSPKLWRRCADALVKGLPRGQATVFLDAQAEAYKKLLKDKELETDKHKQAQLAALHQIFLERPPGIGAHKKLMAELTADLDVALEKERLL